METGNIHTSAVHVLENARRLFEDAKILEEWDRFQTSYALCILAQEEYGKAFLAYLAARNAIPLGKQLERALRSHECKQLAALLLSILQYNDLSDQITNPHKYCGASNLPDYILDAIRIIVHEKIYSRHRDDWHDKSYALHPAAVRIARGLRDRQKQAAMYVGITDKGCVQEFPMVTADLCRQELAETTKINDSIYVYRGKVHCAPSFDVLNIVAVFEVLTGFISPEDFHATCW